MQAFEQLTIQQTRQWIQTFIVKYNLCPFARHEMERGSVRLQCSHATSTAMALACLKTEIECLNTTPTIETTFLMFPSILQDFFDYLDFTELAEKQLEQDGYEGVYQLATFHPDYCFADANVNDVTNYTNRSPYPMLHILREASVEKAIAFYGNTGTIPETNMSCLRNLGMDKVEEIVSGCLIIE